MSTVFLVILVVLAFFLLRPILLSIIIAFILALVFSPLYSWIRKYTKSKNLSAAIICILLMLLIILPFWFLTPIFIEQSFRVFQSSQQFDFVTPLRTIFPDFFASEEFSAEIGNIIRSFVSKSSNYFMNSLANLILDFPTIFLHFLVVFFTFFFVLRDKEQLVEYTKSLLPFSKDIERKLFEYSKAITLSVIYGQVVIGILQGLIAGVGFFIFRVPNALLLTLLASLAGIFPIVGTAIVWIPVVVYLFLAGNALTALGVTVFGVIASSVDNFLRPLFVSRRTKIHSAVVLIGMIGGIFLFGVIGFILGPLILSYLIIILELYRDKSPKESLFTHVISRDSR